LILFLIAVVIASFAGFFASSHPDGLEKVAANLNFEGKAKGTLGIFRDHQFLRLPVGTAGLPYSVLFNALSGIAGVIILFFTFRSIAKTRLYGKAIKKFLNIR
jgi:hypothetical protein